MADDTPLSPSWFQQGTHRTRLVRTSSVSPTLCFATTATGAGTLALTLGSDADAGNEETSQRQRAIAHVDERAGLALCAIRSPLGGLHHCIAYPAIVNPGGVVIASLPQPRAGFGQRARSLPGSGSDPLAGSLISTVSADPMVVTHALSDTRG